jgi:hypothetical protein
MKILRMKPEYIGWTGRLKKKATTRLKEKDRGEYELVSGSYYKPVKSGCVIEIHSRLVWTLAAPSWFKNRIAKDEGFEDWMEFVEVLEKIAKRKIADDEILYTHYYHMIVPPKVQYTMDGGS